MIDRRKAVGAAVGAGQHRQHAGAFQCFRDIDGAYFGMRIRRPHKDGIGLARQMEIVGEPALARDQAGVFLALDRLADVPEEFLPDQLHLRRQLG